MDEINSTKETKECDELKSVTLDQHYTEQIKELRNKIVKTDEALNVHIFRKWLTAFNSTPTNEKMERNCLVTLMLHQLNECGSLQSPFTNLNNCTRNLKSVLQDLDKGSYSSKISCNTEITFNSHHMKDMSLEPHISCEFSQLNAENIELKSELENLRFQLAEQQFENSQLKEILEKYGEGPAGNKEFLDNIKAEILNSIRNKLLHMTEHKLESIQNIQLFKTIFQIHSDDKEFMEILEMFDLDLEQVISRYIATDVSNQKALISRQVLRKFLKKQSTIHEKYERRLVLQATAQKLQLKLAKLKCFSVMRQWVIKSHKNFGKIELWDVLNILEEKYQAVVNDI